MQSVLLVEETGVLGKNHKSLTNFEKPSPLMLAPHDFCNIKANVKVASTENGIIFGNIGTYLKIRQVSLYLQFLKDE
jgi:hypothetical protein